MGFDGPDNDILVGTRWLRAPTSVTVTRIVTRNTPPLLFSGPYFSAFIGPGHPALIYSCTRMCVLHRDEFVSRSDAVPVFIEIPRKQCRRSKAKILTRKWFAPDDRSKNTSDSIITLIDKTRKAFVVEPTFEKKTIRSKRESDVGHVITDVALYSIIRL